MSRRIVDQIAHFWSRVDKNGPVVRVELGACWIWTGFVNPRYGMASFDGRVQGVHRISWSIANGPIPSGLSVCHRCDVTACVNPSHLFIGTPKENSADMVAKGRKARKVSDDEVGEILRLRAAGMKLHTIAMLFGVSKSFVSLVLTGKRRLPLTAPAVVSDPVS